MVLFVILNASRLLLSRFWALDIPQSVAPGGVMPIHFAWFSLSDCVLHLCGFPEELQAVSNCIDKCFAFRFSFWQITLPHLENSAYLLPIRPLSAPLIRRISVYWLFATFLDHFWIRNIFFFEMRPNLGFGPYPFAFVALDGSFFCVVFPPFQILIFRWVARWIIFSAQLSVAKA